MIIIMRLKSHVFFCIIISTMFYFSTIVCFAKVTEFGEANSYSLYVDDLKQETKITIYDSEYSMFLPLREIAEYNGCIVGWNGNNIPSIYVVRKNGSAIMIQNRMVYFYTGFTSSIPVSKLYMSEDVRVIDDTTFIDCETLSEILDAEIIINGDSINIKNTCTESNSIIKSLRESKNNEHYHENNLKLYLIYKNNNIEIDWEDVFKAVN